ncbi:TetR/AcrR family transcriptional regulator C-terminal domain-containing protein [Nocardia rhamnosiphila]|uniref:TetR/AcrR family transcriptional regulator C-terminal domain-containing protein n=1 Tax=Nocardia rhamnosiphila TaxID=426716 RepID=UPI0033CB06BB
MHIPTAEPNRLSDSAAQAAANVSIGRRLAHGGGDPEARLRETTTAATEIARKFPRLRDRIEAAAGTGYTAPPDRSFEFGLAALLEGLQKSLPDRAGG